ncbi:E3 ubiquitin-protein ligase Zswim2-like [Lycorma delicatula]|uniref:E3 ubiquitin-protein ligase Zswim2-like n=1 Tax=Lycorma delicatula TaxID=130591 RepID=UPI003F519012
MTSRLWRTQCPLVIRQQQSLAVVTHLLLIRQNGPTAFSLLDEEGKTFQVLLGDPHTCSCKQFRKSKDLCLHICWVLLKKLQLSSTDPLSYQLGLLPHEMSDCLYPRQRNPAKRIAAPRRKATSFQNVTVVSKRPIKLGDTCPVCLDEFSEDYSLCK